MNENLDELNMTDDCFEGHWSCLLPAGRGQKDFVGAQYLTLPLSHLLALTQSPKPTSHNNNKIREGGHKQYQILGAKIGKKSMNLCLLVKRHYSLPFLPAAPSSLVKDP